jgi:phosphatidylglycerophosphate synthase
MYLLLIVDCLVVDGFDAGFRDFETRDLFVAALRHREARKQSIILRSKQTAKILIFCQLGTIILIFVVLPLSF